MEKRQRAGAPSVPEGRTKGCVEQRGPIVGHLARLDPAPAVSGRAGSVDAAGRGRMSSVLPVERGSTDAFSISRYGLAAGVPAVVVRSWVIQAAPIRGR
ncbi:hypothetical protein TPA0908_33020 [Micromonospora sp. AKA38]|nr:hypothetical protein TPA0908_33020 [Micromonospora sp. AKA38]